MSDYENELDTIKGEDDFAEYEEVTEDEAPAADEVESVDTVEEEPEPEPEPVSEDSLTFSNGVIEKIVAIAMRSVPGVVGMKGGWINRIQDAFGATDTRKGVTVEVTPESAVKVSVSVLIEYGSYAPQVFEDVKNAIVTHVTGMTGLPIAGVNLRIEDVLTTEEIAARNAVAEAANTVDDDVDDIPDAAEVETQAAEEGSDA
ncbi:MAG: Asp23/Gls24 family envelope stress response protein [Coriobacteriales bacterium]|nr:Asp23/Gls24 family envelope stress response protein [Coriobacteriales bacterium]